MCTLVVLIVQYVYSSCTDVSTTVLPSDDDIIFEDFARQRLIGAKDEEEEEGDGPETKDR